MRTKKLTVVIPNKAGQSPELTVRTLYKQTFTDFDIIIVNDDSGNANIARNAGFNLVHTPFVLFSDNDINWSPYALQNMIDCLVRHSDVSYAYGSYELNGKIWCDKEWNAVDLRKRNFVSTMSIVRTAHHPGFDEKLKRLQDWDVWLTMLERGYKGKYVNSMVFTTPLRDGITHNGISWEEAIGAIKNKHKI